MNRVVVLVFAALASAVPCQAQFALDSTAATGDLEHSSGRTTEVNSDYRHSPAQGNVPLAPQGWADMTNTQGVGSPNGPDLPGETSFGGGGGGSGAASSAPLPGSFSAPGNLTLQHQKRYGGKLPPTRLESFVRASGFNDKIYGDEGIYLPPYFGFDTGSRIERGVESGMPDLTTDHRSALPEAWGFPQ